MLYAIRHWRSILVTIFLVCLLFVFLHALLSPCGFTRSSVTHSAQVALGFLMAMESPETAMANYSWPMLVFGWLLCIFGWLLLPLLVAAVLDAALQSIELEERFRFFLRQIGISLNLSDTQLAEFVAEMMRRKDDLLRGHRPT